MAKKVTAKKNCQCLEQADKQLREKFSATFKRALTMDFSTHKAGLAGPFLAIEWTGGTKPKGVKSLPTIECAYCPFCGQEK